MFTTILIIIFIVIGVGCLMWFVLRKRPMSAEVAADVSEMARQENAEKRLREEFDAIMKNITSKARQGSNVYTYWPSMYPSTIEKLQKLGYTVNGQSISWSKKP